LLDHSRTERPKYPLGYPSRVPADARESGNASVIKHSRQAVYQTTHK